MHHTTLLQDTAIVTAAQMQAIESRVFAAGMPVAALMEKVAGLISRQVQGRYPRSQWPRVGVLAGPGHNGGDAWVVARELHLAGYEVGVWSPLTRLKPLTAAHSAYGQSLGITVVEQIEALGQRDWWLDGLFGFGLERPLTGAIAAGVDWLNGQTLGQTDRPTPWTASTHPSGTATPVISIDLPSGLHTDTGRILGTAVRATETLCLGLWKRGALEETALESLGTVTHLPFGLPEADIAAIVGETPAWQRLTPEIARSALPLAIPATSHKYRRGQVLLVVGSQRYRGAALLAGMGARASGVGMVSIAAPAALQGQLSGQLPEGLVIPCPEDSEGAIRQFPASLDLSRFDAIVFGPGLTIAAAQALLPWVLPQRCPLLLDADGLTALAQSGEISPILQSRSALTVLTPHWGEFRRLFPDLSTDSPSLTLAERATQAAAQSGAVVVLKGARTAIAQPPGVTPGQTQNVTWINGDSTPALARGGSGDVLAGLMGGLMAIAQAQGEDAAAQVKAAVWWHSQAGIQLAQRRSVLGVDAWHLSQELPYVLAPRRL